VTESDLGLYSVGWSDRVLFGDRVTVMLGLSPVSFRGKENMTVQEHVKFIGLLWFFSFGRSVCGFSWLPEKRVFLFIVMLWY